MVSENCVMPAPDFLATYCIFSPFYFSHYSFPTVRYETNDLDQAGKIETEKKEIYEKCIPFLVEGFSVRDFDVRDLWFGAPGTVPASTRCFFGGLGFDVKDAAC